LEENLVDFGSGKLILRLALNWDLEDLNWVFFQTIDRPFAFEAVEWQRGKANTGKITKR
jgi:hypothetical protein